MNSSDEKIKNLLSKLPRDFTAEDVYDLNQDKSVKIYTIDNDSECLRYAYEGISEFSYAQKMCRVKKIISMDDDNVNLLLDKTTLELLEEDLRHSKWVFNHDGNHFKCEKKTPSGKSVVIEIDGTYDDFLYAVKEAWFNYDSVLERNSSNPDEVSIITGFYNEVSNIIDCYL